MRVHKSGQVWLDLHHADALAETIPALPTPRKPDPAAVVAGRIEAGQPWLIRLRDTHLFIAGATGPGTELLQDVPGQRRRDGRLAITQTRAGAEGSPPPAWS